MEPVVCLVMIGLAGAAVVAGGIANRRRIPHQLEKLASMRGGVFIPADPEGRPAVKIRGDAVRITVSPAGRWLPRGYRWRAELLEPGTTFRIKSRSSGIALTRWKVVTHDDAFDGAFVLEGRDKDAIRRVCGDAARAIMLKSFRGASVTGGVGAIELQAGAPRDVEDLSNGVDLLLEMARADPHGVRALRGLTGARPLVAEDGRPGGVALDAPGGIVIVPEQVDGQTRTCARGDVACAVLPGRLKVEDGVARAKSSARKLPAQAIPHLDDLGRARVVWTEREVRIIWASIETDRARLEAAIAVLRVLARPGSMGVFR